MNSIDWPWLLATLAWTTGLAVVLSVVSFAYWRAQNGRTRISASLYTRAHFIWLCLGGLLILAGAFASPGPFLLKCTLAAAYAWLLLETGILLRAKK
jgi:hypothetical protein